jgi:ABC-type uncharacterized transport system substrate-binding protein
VSKRRPFIGMFLNLAEDDREISARREAFLQGVAVPGLTVATCFGAGDFVNYGQKAQGLRDTVVDGAGPDLYLVTCWPSLRAVMGVAGNTPIVFAGLVDVSADPTANVDYSENVYGFISGGKNLCAEWVRLLRAVAPTVARAGVLYDMSQARPDAQSVFDAIALAAGALAPPLAVKGIDVGSQSLAADLQAFASEAGTPAGLIVAVGVLAAAKRQTIIQSADALGLPAVYPNRLYALNEGSTSHGGLASRGPYIQDFYRAAGVYARQLIAGGTPAPQIDVTQAGLDPTARKQPVFETVINLKAAKAIGLAMDPAVVNTADLVID